VLSGGERTRLAVARMLLRPANTLLLDEPTNHLDLDSKDVLLEALEDFGGTLIFVSHDRYFVDRLATKIIDIGGGEAVVYPGTYEQFLWSRRQRSVSDSRGPRAEGRSAMADGRSAMVDGRSAMADASDTKTSVTAPERPKSGTSANAHRPSPVGETPKPPRSFEDKKRADAEARKARKEVEARQRRIAELEARIAAAEAGIKDLEAQMSAPGFYENHETSKPVIDRHQALMWEVGDLMNQWEALQTKTKV
jgi:ATP-binding cassette subfamily F protein 3